MIGKRAKSDLLNGRYLLKNCLFAGDLGYLYHAKDMQQGSEAFPGLSVLIHFFPAQAISYQQVPATFKHLQTTINSLNHPILPVTDYGWNGTESYFVMAAPDSWSVKVLPELQHSTTPSSLHETAMTISSALRHSGHINRGLTSQAFLVIPGGLKLLGTALMKQFQAIQPEKDLLPPPSDNYKNRKKMFVPLSLTLATGALLAGGHNFYSQSTHIQTTAISPVAMEEELVLPESQPWSTQDKAPASLLDSLPMSNLTQEAPAPYHLPQAAAPAPENISDISDTKESKTAVAGKPKKFQFAKRPVDIELPEGFCDLSNSGSCQTEIAEATEVKVTAPVSPVPASIPAEKIKSKPVRKEVQLDDIPAEKTENKPVKKEVQVQLTSISAEAIEKPAKKEVQLVKLPEDIPEDINEKNPLQTKITQPRLTANGLNSKQLKNKAYAALRSGDLGEQPDIGAIFYIRLLNRIDAQNPHIRRLARRVVLAYHAQARQQMKMQHKRKSRRSLWMAERVIKEFNLAKMKQTHALLKLRHSE